jgi:hypothetical protein
MKIKCNGIILGSALLLASAGMSWAEPSPDLMNSIASTRLEAAKASEASVVKSNAKPDRAKCSPWAHTRNITAGQSTVAVPDFARHCNK